MSTKSIRCHPDAIHCPSMWQRAVRKRKKKKKWTTLAWFQFERLLFSGLKLSLGGSASRRQNASFLLAVNCGQLVTVPLGGGDILVPGYTGSES